MNEARNTFNAIANRSPLVTSFWCSIGIHRWQKWSDVKEDKRIGYTHLTESIQDRYCDRCNTYDRKVLK